jgi:hypothetical protein
VDGKDNLVELPSLSRSSSMPQEIGQYATKEKRREEASVTPDFVVCVFRKKVFTHTVEKVNIE